MKTVRYFFGIFQDQDIHWFTQKGRVETLAPGAALIRQGEALTALFIVLEGRARVETASGAVIAHRGAGDMLGEMSFVDSAPPSATVLAETPLTVLAIDRDLMRRHLDQDPPFAARFYRALAILLSDRLRAQQPGGSLERDELDDTVLTTLSMAGLRFGDLLRGLGLPG